MTNTTTDLLPALQSFASLLDAQPPEVQEAFQFLLATAMHEAGKFELVSVAEVDGRWHYTLQVLPFDTTIVGCPYNCRRGRYWMASARCAVSIRSEPARSAMVRASFRTR